MKSKSPVLFSTLFLISVFLISGCAKNSFDSTAPKQSLLVGAILPLTGPSAIWGESVRNGMELALENHPEIKVVFEDSKGTAVDGISAYHALESRKPNVFVSSLSIVSVPLASIAKEAKTPLIVTQSAANGITNEYTYRYYSNADHFALPAFASKDSPIRNLSKLAVLYRNDEYAKSVANKIKELSAEQGKEIVFMEAYEPNDLDFSTPLLKVKESKAEAFVFVPTPPSESLAILKKAVELGLQIPLVEVSNVQSDPDTQAKAPKVTFYTEQFAFSIPGNSEEFKAKFRVKYNHEPNFVAAFGYDIVNLLSTCKNAPVKECLDAKTSVTGVTGSADNITNHDIVMPMFMLKVN